MEKVKLESICEKFFGITSRRYRQLADEGYVPQPERGLVDPLDAAKGLLTYYRELSEGGSDLNEARKEKVLVETELKRLQSIRLTCPFLCAGVVSELRCECKTISAHCGDRV